MFSSIPRGLPYKYYVPGSPGDYEQAEDTVEEKPVRSAPTQTSKLPATRANESFDFVAYDVDSSEGPDGSVDQVSHRSTT